MVQYFDTIQRLFDAFDEAGHDLYLVGGAVRDLALEKSLARLDDLDFCTDARPETSLKILNDHEFNTYDLGIEFGTVGCVLYGDEAKGYPKDCQITTYRSDEYYRRGSRHPEVEFGETIEQDLGRRDFSINSMALDGQGELVDPYDGMKDLRDGILRVIGEPLETLAEDPLRILRVGRFMSKLGFQPTEVLSEACRNRADHLLEISRERWFQEMTKLLCGDYPKGALRFLHSVRALGIMLPEVDVLVDEPRLFERTMQVLEQAPADAALAWTAVLHLTGKHWTRLETEDGSVSYPRHAQHSAMLFDGIRRRFRFDNKTGDTVGYLLDNQNTSPLEVDLDSDVEIRRFARALDPHIEPALRFARARFVSADRDDVQSVKDHIDTLYKRIQRLAASKNLRPRLPSGLGNALMSGFDLEPSPLIGELKDWLEESIIAGELENSRDADYYVAALEANPPRWFEAQLDDE
jgi:poly(A) polymerase